MGKYVSRKKQNKRVVDDLIAICDNDIIKFNNTLTEETKVYEFKFRKYLYQ